MRKEIMIILLLWMSYLSYAQNYTSFLDIPYDSIDGINPNLLSLDIYVPSSITEPAPVVTFIHGGSWRVGNKRNTVILPMIDLITQLGFIFVSVNHRLSPNPVDTSAIGAVRFPDHPSDVASAIAWIYQNIETYGGDKSKIGISGYSAGAHIAALVSTNKDFLETHGLTTSNIPCVCMYDAAAYDIPRMIGIGNTFSLDVQNAMGNDPGLWRAASPIFEATTPLANQWLILSQEVPRAFGVEASNFKDTLSSRNYRFTHQPYPLTHRELSILIGVKDSLDFNKVKEEALNYTPSPNALAWGIQLTNQIEAFFQQCFSEITSPVKQVSNVIPLLFYPNPTHDLVYIKGWSSSSISEFNLLDVFGNRLRTESIQPTLDLSDHPPGIYFIQFTNPVSKKTYTQKVVKTN